MISLSINDKARLVNSFTSDPNRPGLDPEYHRGWFSFRAFLGKLFHYRAPEAELNHILNQLLDYFYATAETEEQFLRERRQILTVIWPWLKPRMKHNYGLVKFMEQYGVYSRYFVPLLRCVPGALALCPAHGECVDIFGVPQKVPKWDKLSQFIDKDGMYAFARLRADDAKPALEKASRALVLGAGTLQEVRSLKRFKKEWSKKPHDVPWLVAYDLDTRLKAYYSALNINLDEYGVDLRYEDFERVFENAEMLEAFELVGAWGVASYHDDRLEWLLSNMKQRLTQDGIIKFDLQVLEGGSKLKKRFWQHILVFDRIILRWKSSMKPRSSIIDAVRYVQACCANVGLKIDYYKYDPENPIGVIFQCSRA